VNEGIRQTRYMVVRQLRNLAREPIWIALMLIQPMFWLLLYSQLFRRIVDLPGFGTLDYVDFLAPGIVIMTAFFSGTWAGMGMLQDLEQASSSASSPRPCGGAPSSSRTSSATPFRSRSRA
jgi:ABC-2 type transport system permease protein